jgi:hypothetical protein
MAIPAEATTVLAEVRRTARRRLRSSHVGAAAPALVRARWMSTFVAAGLLPRAAATSVSGRSSSSRRISAQRCASGDPAPTVTS